MADYANEAAYAAACGGERKAGWREITDFDSPLETHWTCSLHWTRTQLRGPPLRAFIVDAKMRLGNVAGDATTRPAAKKSAAKNGRNTIIYTPNNNKDDSRRNWDFFFLFFV